jgi:hypothetical protein
MNTVFGLIVHKNMIFMFILKQIQKNYSRILDIKKYVEKIQNLMKDYGVEELGMESNGLNWIQKLIILQLHFELS